jgi:hypothetical protein
MANFADLPTSPDPELRLQRQLGVLADKVGRSHPLLGLLYVRQIHDRQAAIRQPGWFRSNWHEVIHANGRSDTEPPEPLDEPRHYVTWQAASRAAFGSLADRLRYPIPNWSVPPRPSASAKADSFEAVVDDFERLDNAVNRTSDAGAVAYSTATVRQELDSITKRGLRLRTSVAWQVRFLALKAAAVELALANHAGETTTTWTPRYPLGRMELELALASPGPDQDLAIEAITRLAVHATNALDLDEAYERVEVLRDRFVHKGDDGLRDYVLGAVLGTAAQVYAAFAGREQNPDDLDVAVSLLRRARAHFDDPADLVRNDVYSLHSGLLRLKLTTGDARANQEARDRVEAQVDAMASMLRGGPIGRRDYLAAAYLKACATLQWPADVLPLCTAVFAQLYPDDSLVESDRTNHGAVLLAGWLVICDPEQAPRRARRLLDVTRARSGVIPALAQLLHDEARRRSGEDVDSLGFLGRLSAGQRSTWSSYVGCAARTPGDSLTRLVPFNFV